MMWTVYEGVCRGVRCKANPSGGTNSWTGQKFESILQGSTWSSPGKWVLSRLPVVEVFQGGIYPYPLASFLEGVWYSEVSLGVFSVVVVDFAG